VNWRVVETPSRWGMLHWRVEPVDDEARAEILWPVAPLRLCGRMKVSQAGKVCDVCLHRLSTIRAYTAVVERWRTEGRLAVRTNRQFPRLRSEDHERSAEIAGGAGQAARTRAA